MHVAHVASGTSCKWHMLQIAQNAYCTDFGGGGGGGGRFPERQIIWKLFNDNSENEYEGVPVNSGAIKDLYDNYATYF